MYQLKKLKSLLLLLCIAVTAKAQLSNGNVYNFVNVGKGTSMSITADDVIVTLPDERKYSQLWYAASEGNGFTLRNLANGHYLKSPNATSGAWSTVKVKDGNCIFTATPVGGNYAIRVTGNSGGYNYMHADGGNTIVCWESSNANSQWTMNVVKIDAETLNANWNELASIDPSAETTATYQTHLDNLFSDKACTTLKKSFANENAVKNDADYKALPATLQEMVLKVYNDSWAEENFDANKSDWDSDYAKRYRVQLYEPYNEPEAAASALGLNAHTNLNNPTGIFANDREALYVMVEGEIETGASLYLVSYTGNGELYGYNDGYELKQGLNIIPSFGDDNNYCINYVVHTFDTSKGKGNKAKAYHLSDFEDLKIHIEGGYINGYYNKMGDELYGSSGDKAADWDYVEARATQTTVTILGEYITLQFPLNDAVDSDGATQKGMSYYLDQVSVEDVIDEWDKVMLWERLVLGVLDEETTKAEAKKSPYSDKDYVFEYTGTDNDGFESGYGDYYNVHGLSLGIPNSYMYGGWRHCGYNYGTMQGIMVNMLTDAGAHWGPGHEIGHQHQNLLTVNGLTEVTNNLFANVVLWYFGETTSRVNGSEGALSNVLAAFNTEGSDFFTNNIWALTHMYYKLFLYYHVLGHNTKFYPRLFEMLRQDPMSGGYNQNGATSLLHFYKKCCLASGDDLTEFFRAYGFFSVMDNRLVGDYSNSVYTTTQADIDAAIKEVKDLGYDENIAVLFINDATGETIKSHKGDNLELYGETTVCAEVGGYASFADNTTPDYTYSVSGTTVTMEGEGGTGFAIFNEKGEILAFSDKKTFNISNECAAAIASGKAEIKSVKADNTPVEAVDVMDTNDAEAKYEALGELLDAAKTVTNLADATGTKVGYYRTDLLTDLQAAYETAKTVYDNKTVASYNAVCDVLYQEYANVIADDFARIDIIEGNAYQLTNKYHSSRSMAVNTSNNQMSGVATADTDEQKWYFEASNSLGRYYLKNKATSKYPGGVSRGAVLSANKDESSKGADDGAAAYELRDMGSGVWALVNDESLHCASSQSYNIVGWGADAEASQWYITAVEVDQNAEALHELQTLIEKTELLVDEMATVQMIGKLPLQATSSSEGYFLSTNACHNTLNNASDGQGLAGLLDESTTTFFHSDYNGKVSETHYLQVDLGSGNIMSKFTFNYSTRSNGDNCPTTIVVSGCNSADGTFNELGTFTAADHGLPNGNALSWESPVINNSANYRYLRFSVTATENSKVFFVMSTFGITSNEPLVKSISDKYVNFITADALTTICNELYDAKHAYTAGTATTADIEALQAQYDILLGAHKDANDVEFNAKKQELFTLISNTNSLISTCGRIIYTPATLNGELPLQTTNSSGSWYVSTNADQNTGGGKTDGGGIAALVDNDYSTYFHTRWDGTKVYEAHHIQIDMGEGVAINDFVFSYKPRNGSPAPTAMTVYGSNNASSFTDVLTTITSGLPAHNSGSTYTSSTIVSDKAYRYLRFVVTGSQGPGGNQYNGQYFFGMLELDLTAVGRPESYTAELNSEPGDATPELLLATYHAANDAQGVYDNAKTKSQVQDAIDALQAQYDALYNAKYPSVEFAISVTGGNGNGGVMYKGIPYTTTLLAPEILTVDELAAIPLDGYGYVAKSVTLGGTTITVTYNKVYTVKVTGGNGNGGITYDGKDYADGTTFDAEQGSFSVNELTAIIPDGYILKEAITLNHETGVINVAFSARPLVDITKYYTLACKATDHGAYIRDNGSVINGRSTEGSLFQFEKANDDNGYYIKSYVTDKYLNSIGTSISVDDQGTTVWTLALHSTGAMTLCIGNDQYLNNNGSADATCPYLQIKGHNGGPSESNACSLWALTESTPLDKSALRELIDETNVLVASCYQGGNVDGELIYLGSLHLTPELIASTKSTIADAEVKYNSKATTSSEYNTILTALQAACTTLANAKTSAEAEAAERNTQRTALNNLITTTNHLITTCGTTPGDATQALIDEVSAAVTSAQAVAEYMGSTVEQLTNATTTLQGQYNVLLAAQQSTAKTELRALIEQTTELIAQCGTVEYTTTIDQVALQTGDQNADFWLSTNAQEPSEGAIANLVGIVDEDGFFHSSWSAQVGAAHYLQVDMGAEHALKEFAFSYTTRDNNDGGPHPSTIVVSGSNSTSNDSFVELATINSGLPTNGNTAWNENNENVITASEAYRYLRFTVTASAGTNGCSHGNGEYYFAMARFSLNSISRGYTAELQNTNVTAEQLIAVYQANAAAATLADNSAVQADLIAEKDKLQALYDALLEAATSVQLPVTLTTDANAPVLYVIKTKRDNNPVLQYDESSGMFSVTTAVAGRATQAFYFMKGDKVEGTQQVYIYPYMAGGKVLAADDVNDGHSKALAMDKSTATYEQWVFVEQADGYYNLQPAGKSTYLSNYGGTGNKMGFYSSNPKNDTGSLFKFEPTTVEGSYYYLKLKDYYENQVKVASSEIQGGTAVGYYPIDKANAYNSAYSNAMSVLESLTASDEDYTTAYNTLKAANEELVINMPEVGKYYTIASACSDHRSGQLMYATSENAMVFSREMTRLKPEALWTFTSDGYLENLQTGCSVSTASTGGAKHKLGETPKKVDINSISVDGQVLLTPNGGQPLHAQDNGSVVVGWGAYDAGSASAWRIVEVEDMSLVNFALKIGQYRHAGLYLNYATEIPEGIKAYVVNASDEEEGVVIADELEGSILPARTAVIVKGNAAEYKFMYTAAEYDGTDDLDENLLGGSAYLKYQQVKKAGNLCCVFGQKSGEVGLYKNYVQYINANGSTTKTEGETTTDYAKSDNGTHFKVSANKIYYEYTPSTGAGASAFRFRFNNKSEGTTGIDCLMMFDDAVIYNLYGQRLIEIVEPGIYIINGKKMYVSEKMIGNNN